MSNQTQRVSKLSDEELKRRLSELKLTKENKTMIKAIHDSYIDFVTNNSKYPPFTREDIMEDVARMYSLLNYKAPKYIFIAANMIEEKLMTNIIINFFDGTRVEGIEQKYYDKVYDQFLEMIGPKAYSDLVKKLKKEIPNYGEEIKQKVYVEQSLGIGHETWIAFYEFFEKQDLLDHNGYTVIKTFLKKGILSVQYFEDWCVVCRLPKKVHYDANKNMHNTTGPAIEWIDIAEDGTDYYNFFIHGVHFDAKTFKKVTDPNVSLGDILTLDNNEQRRAAMSVQDVGKILKEAKAVKVSTYKHTRPKSILVTEEDYEKMNLEQTYTMWKVKREDLGITTNTERPFIFLEYPDISTDRVYQSGVTNESRSVSAGMAMKFGISEDDYINGMEAES